MKIRPTKGRVLVLPKEDAQQTKSGLFIGANNEDDTQKAEVISLHEDNLSMLEGDTVLFRRGHGVKINIDDKDYLMVNESDILGVYE